MFFEWDGVRFKYRDGKWHCVDYAMRGPTGNLHNKEVPEPWQTQIEKAWQEKNRQAAAEMQLEASRHGLNPPKKRRRRGKKKKESLDSRVKKLIKKESKAPKVPRKKRGNIVGGISLSDLMGK
jgi:hypothetical protein